MGPGLPGFGFASVFYVAAAFVAPFRELVLTFRGQSSPERWRTIVRQLVISLLIVGAVVATYVGIAWLARASLVPDFGAPLIPMWIPSWTYALVGLSTLLTAVWLWAAWARRRPEEDPHVTAACHAQGFVFAPSLLELPRHEVSLASLRLGHGIRTEEAEQVDERLTG